MTDLVEKVRAALSGAFMDGNIRADAEDKMIRAAIKAVLEHYSEVGNVSEAMGCSSASITYNLNASIEDNERVGIAAAFKAELERFNK